MKCFPPPAHTTPPAKLSFAHFPASATRAEFEILFKAPAESRHKALSCRHFAYYVYALSRLAFRYHKRVIHLTTLFSRHFYKFAHISHNSIYLRELANIFPPPRLPKPLPGLCLFAQTFISISLFLSAKTCIQLHTSIILLEAPFLPLPNSPPPPCRFRKSLCYFGFGCEEIYVCVLWLRGS